VIILDTDVLSTLMLVEPNQSVLRWIDNQPVQSIWTTTVSVYEISIGIALLPDGVRRRRLESAFTILRTQLLKRRILPLDESAAGLAGTLGAKRKLQGFNVGLGDTLIAGIALSVGAVIATGNAKDFRDLGVHVINPWHTVADDAGHNY
jgi:predicted nucleic acid-binding protein